jgi:hypothetical protein
VNDLLEGGRFEFSAALVVFLAHAESVCTTLQIPHSLSPVVFLCRRVCCDVCPFVDSVSIAGKRFDFCLSGLSLLGIVALS